MLYAQTKLILCVDSPSISTAGGKNSTSTPAMLETLFASLQVGDAGAVGNRPKVTFANCTELDLRLGIPEKNWEVILKTLCFLPCKMY